MKFKSYLFLVLILPLFMACKNKTKDKEVTVISVEEVYEAMNNENSLQLIDVRTLEEFNEGHLIHARNICVTDDDFEEKASKLNKDDPVYLYCRSGKRSERAAEILREMGFTEIYDMEGGFLKWEENHHPVEK